MMAYAVDRIQSTLDLLILKTLSWGPAHGYAIARWLEQLTGSVLKVGEGTLYPALHRLESRGAVESTWQIAESGRRARVYSLTRAGRQQLATEQQTWTEFVRAMGKVLRATEQPA
jgi:transcriptional regulator